MEDAFTRVIAAVRAVDRSGELTATDLADILWLAARVRAAGDISPTEPKQAGGAITGEGGNTGLAGGQTGAGEKLRPPGPEETPITDSPPAPGERPPSVEFREHIDIAVAAAPVLEDRVILTGILKRTLPRMSIPSEREIDERATVEEAARTGLLLPLPRRRLRPRLRVALVVDGSPAMTLWSSVVVDVERMLRRSGAFRDVRSFTLLEGGAVRPGSGRRRGGAALSSGVISDPTGRTLVLLFGDAVGSQWNDGTVGEALGEWARRGPVAVVQALPRSMWSRTSFGPAPPETVTARHPFAPNSSYRLASFPTDVDEALGEAWPTDEPAPPVPIVALERTALAAWARLLAGAGDQPVPAVFPLRRAQSDDAAPPPPLPPSLDERVLAFQRSVSPTGRRLMALLSATAPPLTVATMRLVRRALLPGASFVHEAEVLLGGLLEVIADGSGLPEELQLDFVDEQVRWTLLSQLSAREALEIIRLVVARLPEGDPGAQAVRLHLENRTGSQRLEPSRSALERIAAEVFLAVGGTAADRMRASAGDRPERGRWVLIDGDESRSLQQAQALLARELGSALASQGYSLVTLGRPGVSYVVARAFADALRPQGFTSAIYRLLHLVPVGEAADFGDRGRTLFPSGAESLVAAALARADCVLTIGQSSFSTDIADAAGRLEIPTLPIPTVPIPTVPLREDASTTSGSGTPSPEQWTEPTARAFVRAVVDKLNQRFPDPAMDPAMAPLLRQAAVALDQRDLEGYNRHLDSLRKEAVSLVSRDAALALQSDMRRPAYRLLGHLAARQPQGRYLALRAEQRTVRLFWETRTLWLALEPLDRSRSGIEGAELRALAAACASIRLDLLRNERIDPGRECRTLLERVLTRIDPKEQAVKLARQAVEYEELRDRLPAGPERTARMNELVDDMEARRRGSSAMPEAEVWFASGAPGQRIAALALLLATGDPAGYPIASQAIEQSRSPFEQYTALRVVDRLLDRLEPTVREQLRQSLLAQRAGPPGIIDPSDPSRWSLSGDLLSRIAGVEKPPARALLVLTLDEKLDGATRRIFALSPLGSTLLDGQALQRITGDPVIGILRALKDRPDSTVVFLSTCMSQGQLPIGGVLVPSRIYFSAADPGTIDEIPVQPWLVEEARKAAGQFSERIDPSPLLVTQRSPRNHPSTAALTSDCWPFISVLLRHHPNTPWVIIAVATSSLQATTTGTYDPMIPARFALRLAASLIEGPRPE